MFFKNLLAFFIGKEQEDGEDVKILRESLQIIVFVAACIIMGLMQIFGYRYYEEKDKNGRIKE